MSLCLAAGGLVVKLGFSALTLAWRHSVENTLWEEDWRETPRGLVMTEARVRGSGAGMEPPPEARFEGGAWRWRPAVPPLKEVTLRRSGVVNDWSLCAKSRCRELGELVPAAADPVTLFACRGTSIDPR